MNIRDYTRREAMGVCMRADELDILIAEEARMAGERRRAVDEADGYFAPLTEDGED